MKKKILFTTISGAPSADTGGPNKIIHNIINSINRDEFIPSYFSKHAELSYDNLGDIIKKNSLQFTLGNRLFKKSSVYRSIVRHPLYLKIFFKNLDRIFNSYEQKINYDIIHAHDAVSMFYFLADARSKKVLTIHSKGSIKHDLADYIGCKSDIISEELNRLDQMENQSLAAADIITFPSIAAKELFLSYKDVDDHKIRIVYNGIDLDIIKKLDKEKTILQKYFPEHTDSVFIFNVAEHVKPKRIEILLDVIKKLNHKMNRKAVLLNIGKGCETSNLKKYALNNNIGNFVKFVPMVSNEEIIRIMKIVDYFVMPSERVVFDMVILEAMACGAVVIAANDGGNKEIIIDGKNGYLVDRITAEKIIKILDLPVDSIKRKAIEGVNSFSIEKMTREYTKLYTL